MRIVARGKEDVLLHMEDHANAMCGQPGEYMLLEDKGKTFLLIAGQMFCGDFLMEGSPLPFTVRKGIVVGLGESDQS